FHSINVPSEWGRSAELQDTQVIVQTSFHSSNVPSEWGGASASLEGLSIVSLIELKLRDRRQS
ncbi:MAG: hypothetical protein ACK471_15515, partial [Dolichospermum sp.]